MHSRAMSYNHQTIPLTLFRRSYFFLQNGGAVTFVTIENQQGGPFGVFENHKRAEHVTNITIGEMAQKGKVNWEMGIIYEVYAQNNKANVSQSIYIHKGA